FASLTIDEVVARLDAAKIANGRVNDMAALWDHPQLQARGRWTQVDSPAGPLPALLPPGIAGPERARMDAIPALGEHTDAILAELGIAVPDAGAS
ncbi:MAG TPA: CoA transferase, partial [Burkholderiaceae bacterium]|nr:CoA transferase [Burkholderiaceae bacterium]